MNLKKYFPLTFTLALYCLLPLNQLKAGIQLKNEFVSDETLDSLCDTGSTYNAFGGGVGGYMENIMKGWLALGKMSGQDFTKIERWFYRNCPSGW